MRSRCHIVGCHQMVTQTSQVSRSDLEVDKLPGPDRDVRTSDGLIHHQGLEGFPIQFLDLLGQPGRPSGRPIISCTIPKCDHARLVPHPGRCVIMSALLIASSSSDDGNALRVASDTDWGFDIVRRAAEAPNAIITSKRTCVLILQLVLGSR